MDVEKAFHMTGGVGKTSYAKNSSLQVLSLFLSFIHSFSIYHIFPHHFLVLVYNSLWYAYIPALILLFQQKKESDKVKHIIIQTVEELYLATTPKSIGIADLGCSSGPNTLSLIKDIFQAIQAKGSCTTPQSSGCTSMIFQQMTSIQSSRPSQSSKSCLGKTGKMGSLPFSWEATLAHFMEDCSQTVTCTLSTPPSVFTGFQGYITLSPFLVMLIIFLLF